MMADPATVADLLARGETAIAYCLNAACPRFRDYAGVRLDLKSLPIAASIDQLERALACQACERRSAAIAVSPRPRVTRADLAWVFGLAPRPAAAPVDRDLGDPVPIDPADHPLVKAALAAFPGAEIVAIRPRSSVANGVREGLA